MIADEPEGPVSFGEWLRRRRKALDLTQAALARQVGCAVITIKKIEYDQRRPSRQMAQRLTDCLAIPDAARNDFIRMARGQFVPAATSLPQAIRPPAFLQQPVPTAPPSPPRFVARQRQLARLNAHLDSALAGHGRLLFITGEAGQGKTTLLAEFARRAQQEHPDLVPATGACNARGGLGDPYLPFRDILGLLSGDLQARWTAGAISREQALRLWSLFPYTVQAILDVGPNLIGSLVPGPPLLRRISAFLPERPDWLTGIQSLSDRQRSQPSNWEQGHLLEAVTRVLQTVSARRPLLLILDDLQWIDDASKDLLFHLGRRLAGSRILLAGAYRPVEVSLGRPTSAQQAAQHPLEAIIAEFKRYYGDIQLDLDQQSTADRRAFMEALVDSEPNRLDETFRESLFRHTRGRPLFTVEMLRNMQADGTLTRDEGGQWVANRAVFSQELPARIEAVIAQRVNRLEAPFQELLTVASVEGELFTAQVRETMQTYHDRVGAAQAAQMLGACLCQAGDLTRAESYFASALDFYRQMQMRPFLVRTLLALAHLFTQQGRSIEAHAAQNEAQALMAAMS